MSDFVICINNESNPASLIVGKVYRTLSDAEAEAHNMLRVDEDKSEPDGYLYPASMFASIELSEGVKQALTAATYRGSGVQSPACPLNSGGAAISRLCRSGECNVPFRSLVHSTSVS